MMSDIPTLELIDELVRRDVDKYMVPPYGTCLIAIRDVNGKLLNHLSYEGPVILMVTDD